MSGTVRETAPELWADYGLKVALVPRNRPNLRRNRGHVLYPDAASKWAAVAEAVRTVREGEAMRPVLVGTRSVGDSDARSEERRVGEEWSVRVDLGGRGSIKKKKKRMNNNTLTSK